MARKPRIPRWPDGKAPSHPDIVSAHDEELLRAAAYRLAILRARESLIHFIRFMRPKPGFDYDTEQSLFDPSPFHCLLASKVETLLPPSIDLLNTTSWTPPQIALSCPPQHGKSTISCHYGLPWLIGKNPKLALLFATYNEDFGRTNGATVKGIMQDPRYKQVFPGVELSTDSKAKEEMFTTAGGRLTFAGANSAITGKTGDGIIIDDPIKSYKDAQSAQLQKDLRDWYSSVVDTRLHNNSFIMVIHTRWVENDLIGWLCDPNHPEHNAEQAKGWDYINIPAIQNDPKVAAMLGLKVGDALWEKRHSLKRLEARKRRNPKVFEALYQGNPAPEDGAFFTKDMLVGYHSRNLPAGLSVYGSSDHAITIDREADAACVGCVGVDENDDIWVLPDVDWRQMDPAILVEAIVAKIKAHRPLRWFKEDDLIGRSINPALIKKMTDERAYTTLTGVSAYKDKLAKAASIQARMSLRKVHFPTDADWWPAAMKEILKFPNGTHDDFVDFIGIIGRGLDILASGSRTEEPANDDKPSDTFAAMKRQTDRQRFGELEQSENYAAVY